MVIPCRCFESCVCLPRGWLTPYTVPIGWQPRAKQQPTGLIAYSVASRQSRPVLILYHPRKNAPDHWSEAFCGGRYRTRTCDLLHVKQMLYQLS